MSNMNINREKRVIGKRMGERANRISLNSLFAKFAIVLLLSFFSTQATAGEQYAFNGSNVNIPDAGTSFVSSTITISGAPAEAVVTGIDVYFRCVHPYSGDLNVDLNADSQGNLGNYDLWQREGGSADNPSRTVNGITTFNGLSVNRTWYLYARDEESGDSGYIDEWSIRVYYNEPVSPPSIISPGSVSAPGQQLTTTTPTFQWGSVSGANRYGLYISQNHRETG